MIVDIATRSTRSEAEFDLQRNSPASLLLVDRDLEFPDGPGVIELHVGKHFFFSGDSARRDVPANGVNLKAKSAIVVETQEIVRLPRNMVGLVIGKGSLIFRGLIISPGKIDPSFSGPLLIAIFNAGDRSILVKPESALCNCVLIETETNSSIVSKHNPQPSSAVPQPFHERMANWIGRNKEWLPIVLSALALITSIVAIFVKQQGGG